ncbi:hypothetical protein BC793_12487 [Actinoplanes xinjiangensis]|uniref:Uncharacterized protein n=2 Tax=Actinoplanes xinjiangensis TaxID=512350 RepID=A0A316EV44_9ACTN|nr:hypothetical protein BC793_12487 [Actinoplanes xinjiangensis]
MRCRAAGARRRQRRSLAIRRIVGLQWSAYLDIVTGQGTDERGFDRFLTLRAQPPTYAPSHDIALEEYQAWWHQVSADVRREFRLAADERILTPRQTGAADAFIEERIEEWLRVVLPTGQRRYVGQATGAANRSGILALIAFIATMAVGGLVAYALHTPLAGWWGRAQWLSWTLGLGCVVALWVSSAPGAALAVGWRVLAVPILWAARQLDRAQPLHLLRWTALAFFIAGSTIDLWTSYPG